jgi:hypothetical protein
VGAGVGSEVGVVGVGVGTEVGVVVGDGAVSDSVFCWQPIELNDNRITMIKIDKTISLFIASTPVTPLPNHLFNVKLTSCYSIIAKRV